MAELAVLRSYVENQAILETIRLYRASKCKQTKEQGSEDSLWTHILPFYKIIFSFFSFFCQGANKIRSNCAIMGCNLSKKHKLKLYKTPNGEPNYVARSFFNIDRYPNTINLDSWLVHVLCDIKATWHQEASVSLEYTMKIHLADIFYLFGVSPPSIHLSIIV